MERLLPIRGRCAGITRGSPRSALSLPHRAARAATPVVALAAALACCTPARAAFEPFKLVSAEPTSNQPALQADYAYDPAISADGRYVAFTGAVASLPGIYRKDISNGALDLVAAGNNAGAPSISANGQYVSFTTNQNPATGAPGGGATCSSVYVRNMQHKPTGEPAKPISTKPEPWKPETSLPPEGRAFTLVSAPNGSAESLAYLPTPGSVTCGAAAAARVALSADGRRVAFTVLSPSNLTGACEVSRETETLTCPTPPDQVAVRDWESETTTLVSATLASLGGTPEPVPHGAALSGPTSTGVRNLPNGGQAELALGASSAAISADGSTVAWMGEEVAAQAPVTKPLPMVKGISNSYAEPLWRRIADGPAAPTRRVLAGGDPSAPECPPACPGGLDLAWDTQGISGQDYLGAAPEYGSYTSRAGTNFLAGAGLSDPLAAVTPQLSADGTKVALLSTQPNYGNDPNFGQFDATKPPPANAFIVDMAPGLTRAQAIQRLTDWASLDFGNTELTAPVTSIALSPDGTRLAFTTERIAFPLAPPALITPTLSQAGLTQLYEVNLLGGTLAMVSFGYDSQPANAGVFATAFSGDGKTLALASGATNLVYGVVNQGSEVFTTEEIHSPAAPGQQSIGPPPSWPAAEVPWSISATATPSPDGTLVLYVSVPGAGQLSASAVSAVVGGRGVGGRKSARKSTRRARARGSARARRKGSTRTGARTRSARKPRVPAGAQIAHAVANVTAPEVLELHLIPAARYDSLLAGGDLYATITVAFTAPSHQPLHQTLRVSFPRRPPIYNLPQPGYPLPRYPLPKHPAPKHSKPRHTKHRGRRG